MKLENALKSVANSAIENQNSNGSFPPGQNGPHAHPETPVRNTSHYLVLLSRLYDETKSDKYHNALSEAVQYLSEDEVRPYGYTFNHLKQGPDRCNGTIGAAWTIEGIAEAGRILDIPDLIETAEEVFLQHPFDEKLGLWKRLEVDGEVLCLDSTYNHQLWFAAAGGLLNSHHDVDPEIDRQVRIFLDRAQEIVGQRKSGLFEMLAQPPLRLYPYTGLVDDGGRMLQVLLASNSVLLENTSVRDALLSYTPLSRLPLTREEYYQRMIGYHSFHLYGFALLKMTHPDHSFWQDGIIEQAMSYIEAESFVQELESNQYSYPYNISGVELAFAIDIFGNGGSDTQQKWLRRQFEYCWDSNTERMGRNNPDCKTLTARLYEASRIQDWNLEVL